MLQDYVIISVGIQHSPRPSLEACSNPYCRQILLMGDGPSAFRASWLLSRLLCSTNPKKKKDWAYSTTKSVILDLCTGLMMSESEVLSTVRWKLTSHFYAIKLLIKRLQICLLLELYIYATLDAADSRSVGFADQVTRNRSNSINHDSTIHVLLIIMTIIGSWAPAQATRPA